MKGLGDVCTTGLKSLVDDQQSVKYKSTTIKTWWPHALRLLPRTGR